jgi:hypothetical protein
MIQRRTPLRKVSLKKEEKKRMGLSDLKKSGLVQKASEFTSKPRRKLKARSPNNKGWWDVALEIWDERKRECEVCHLWLLNEDPTPILFSHLLPRGSYRNLKRDKRNIRIHCAECHQKWHDFGPEALSEDLEWKKITDLYYALRDEANKVKP